MADIAAACGSTAFKTVIQAGCSYIAALLPDEAQDEIFTSPDVKVGGTLIPDATAVRADGGCLVNGTSGFATGCHDADWHLLTVRVESGNGPPEVLWTAVPMGELEILDDWYVSGLAGEFPSKRSADDPFYRMPVLLMFCAWMAPNALGLARSALAEFTERTHRRGITYTFHERQNEATVTHLQVAEAALKLSCAELLTSDFIGVIKARAASGEPHPPEERARIRAQNGHVTRLCKEAVDLLGSASGASSLHLDVPIQRAVRDLNALSLHSFVNPATNLEIYGRILSGVDPGTPFLQVF